MSSPKLTVYTYARCSTCRNAVKWLRSQEIQFVEKPIRETPPTERELRRMLALQEGQIRRLFNTSGEDYRAMNLAAKLAAMTEEKALALLAGNGRLIRRPFVLGRHVGLVGFKVDAWATSLR